MPTNGLPDNVYVGASKDARAIAWAKRLGIKVEYTHAFWLFTFRERAPVVIEAAFGGVRQAPFDAAHQADGWSLFEDVRLLEIAPFPRAEKRAALWWYALGNTGKVYEYPLLVRLVLRIAWEAWRHGRALASGRLAYVCTSFVNECARTVLGAPYIERPDPSVDEIAASPYLRPVPPEQAKRLCGCLNCQCRGVVR